jgi:hypothetical protein
VLESDALILVHVSRRTDLNYARKRFTQVCGQEKADRVHFLMDFRSQRMRYEAQVAAAEEQAAAQGQKRAEPAEPSEEE